MYKVKLTAKASNKRKAQRMTSEEIFRTIESAQAFIEKSKERQEMLCRRQLGLIAITETTENGVQKVLYQSPMIFAPSLLLEFEIIAEQTA